MSTTAQPEITPAPVLRSQDAHILAGGDMNLLYTYLREIITNPATDLETWTNLIVWCHGSLSQWGIDKELCNRGMLLDLMSLLVKDDTYLPGPCCAPVRLLPILSPDLPD